MSRNRALIAGVLSPFAAAILDELVSKTVTRLSSDPEHDWLFRISCTALAITLPFFVTLTLAIKDRRHGAFPLSSKVALTFAVLSACLVAVPVNSAIERWKQSRHESTEYVAAPGFDTVDIFGKPQRLADQKNKVVLIDLWATWCEPCRAEVPKLEQLYQSRKDQGFVVFGISNEDTARQRQFVEQVSVSYPLLTLDGQVPNFYRDVVRYPVIFLIDRQGLLHRAPGPGQPFDKLQAAVDNLLRSQVAQTLPPVSNLIPARTSQ